MYDNVLFLNALYFLLDIWEQGIGLSNVGDDE